MSTPPRRPLELDERRHLALVGAGALIAFIASASLSRDLIHWWWYAGTLASAAVFFGLGRWVPNRVARMLGHLLQALGMALSVSVVLQAGGVFHHLAGAPAPDERIALWFGNPNILAASLALLTLAAATSPVRPVAAVALILGAPALALTGSRGALTALTLSLVVMAAIRSKGRRRWRRWLLAAVPLAIAVVALAVVAWWVPPNPNLLRRSNDLASTAWTRYEPTLRIESAGRSGPGGRSGSTRVWAEASPTQTRPGLVLGQSVGRSEPGAPYVASVYARSDVPTRFVLSTNLSSVGCDAIVQWTRCITPPGTGDGHTIAQFQLRAERPGAGVDVDLWGAQVERRAAASRAQPTTPLSRTLERLNPATWPGSYGWASRLQLQQDAWTLFLQQPVAGSGLGTFAARLRDLGSRYSDARHAQNLILNLLVTSGVLGVVGWSLQLFGVLAIYRARWAGWLPFLTLLLVLNLTDATYYTTGFYYPWWLLLGLLARPSPPLGPPGAHGRDEAARPPSTVASRRGGTAPT